MASLKKKFTKVTQRIKHYVIPQSRLPPSSPIKSHLSFDETYDAYRFDSTRLESFKEQYVQVDKPCNENVHKGILTNINNMTECVEHYAIPQCRLPPSSPIKFHLFFDETYEDYRFESTRLGSFKNWPWISGLWIKPEKLAAAGFYYTGESDKVKCFECPIEIYGKWQVDDNPMAYHQQWSGECRFIRNIPCGNVPIGTDPNTIPAFVPDDDDVIESGIYNEAFLICKLKGMASRPKRPESDSREARIAIAMALRPKHPEYASYAVRLVSFDRWPKGMSQTKKTLATAGFYYTGSGDQTLCYYCGGELRNWELEDNPWVEHANWFLFCPYIYLIKGTEFVSSISGRTGIRAENILSEINKLNEKIEKNIDAESIASGSSQNSIYSEETNIAEVNAASGEASSEQQSVQGDKRCDMEPCKICYSREVHKGILTNIKKMTECVEHYAIPQCRLPPSSPIKSHLFFDETYADYRFESTRLESFKNWPWTGGLWIKPEKLAAAGFYYTGESDKVKCFECPIEIYGIWQMDDNPMAYHQQWSGECRFINNIPCGNVPIGTDLNTIPAFVPKGVGVCGIYNKAYFEERVICKLKGMASRPKYVSIAARIARGMASGPKHPEYVSYAARLASFDRWPKVVSQTKETLATAGFYYTGSGDQTLCYYCGGELRDWEPEDDPWVKHAKRFEYCPYLILTKGTEFVSSIAGRTDIEADSILLAINKFENIEKFYSEETNTAEVSAVSGEASSEEQLVQGLVKPRDEDEISCKICHSREVRILFMPCRHLLACAECAKNMKICGVCRKPVERTVQARILYNYF
ncbi:E3 ubiquitin-protein ligase XIAP-like isoform X2 [Temnothorax longispinosus]